MVSEATPIIELNAVTKSYQDGARVLEHANLKVRQGEFLYVIGGTGAGKSTLLRLLAAEELPTQGSVALFGYDLARASESALRAIRQSIGFVPQDVRLIPDLSVFDNVALALGSGGLLSRLHAEKKHRIHELLDRLGLAKKRNHPARAISGGEAQRVAVARALVRQPRLVIADEPTGSQDRDQTWALMDLFQRCHLTGATVVVATHDRDIVRRLRKRCAILQGGRMAVEEQTWSL